MDSCFHNQRNWFREQVNRLVISISVSVPRVSYHQIIYHLSSAATGLSGWRAGQICPTRGKLSEYLKASPIYLNKIGSGALSTALLDATETIRGYYQLYLPARRLSVIIPVLIWVPVLFYDWVSALIMLFTAPFIPLFMILIGHKAERKIRNCGNP